MQPSNLNQNNPKVSVIIPTYNRNRRLKRAIQSVLDQTYQDFEIIVIDDSSSDSPRSIVTSFQDSRIKFICHEYNKGGAAARNTGIKASTGEYIAFLDSDDEWLPRKLHLQFQYLESHSEKIGAVYTGLAVISQEDKVLSQRNPTASGDLKSAIYAENCIGPLSTLMVRRKYLFKCGLFDEKLPSCQDWDLCIRIARCSYFAAISETLVRYYVNTDSITVDPQAKAIGHRYILKNYLPHIKSNKRAYSKQSIIIGHYLYRSGKRKKAIFFFYSSDFKSTILRRNLSIYMFSSFLWYYLQSIIFFSIV